MAHVEPKHQRRGWRAIYLALALLTGLLGLAMAGLGLWLVSPGGTFYYVAAGVLLAVGALMSWKGQDRPGLVLMGLAVLLTAVWAVIEIAGKGWMPVWGIDFAGRVGVIAALVNATGLAYLLWVVPPRAASRRVAFFTLLGGLVVLGSLVAAK